MKVPVEITYRNLENPEAIDNLVREKIAKLEQFCDHITSCRVAVEKTTIAPVVVLPIGFASISPFPHLMKSPQFVIPVTGSSMTNSLP